MVGFSCSRCDCDISGGGDVDAGGDFGGARGGATREFLKGWVGNSERKVERLKRGVRFRSVAGFGMDGDRGL